MKNYKVDYRLFLDQLLLLLLLPLVVVVDSDALMDDNEECFEHGMLMEGKLNEIDFEVLRVEELLAYH